jgi:hypothetical protein
MNGEVLVDAFFDQPSLLAVRFRLDADLSHDRVASFALSRRPDAAAGGIARIGTTIVVGMVVVGAALVMVPSCSLQRSHPPMVSSGLPTDCRHSTAWLSELPTLGDELAPGEALQPWYVRTLVTLPRELAARGDATGGWLQPRCSSADRTAHQQGVKLVQLLVGSFATRGVAVILDLPGPQAVAAAAAMADTFTPVVTIDNLPHPAGVVPVADTLAALVYWRPELVAGRAQRRANNPPLFILEGERMRPYGNEPGRFDNRSRARLPDAAALRDLGVERVLYVRQPRGAVREADDLNALFCAYAGSGIEVRHLALDSLDRFTPLASDQARDWFWQNYSWGRPEEVAVPPRDDADAGYASTPRTPPAAGPGAPSTLDGGQSRRPEVLDQLDGDGPGSSGGWWPGANWAGGSHWSGSSGWWSGSGSQSSGGSWGRSISGFFSGFSG